jgi:hypothetical protein
MSRPPRIRLGGDGTALDARTVHAGMEAQGRRDADPIETEQHFLTRGQRGQRFFLFPLTPLTPCEVILFS